MRDSNGWSPDDYLALVGTADALGVPAEWIAAVMLSESALNPRAANPSGNARGLIQFLTSTLAALGASQNEIDNFTAMTPAEQMPFVQKFYATTVRLTPNHEWVSRAQMYQATYLPASLRKGVDPSSVIATVADGSKFFANRIFSRDGQTITVGDLEARLAHVIASKPSKWSVALEGIANAGGAPGNSGQRGSVTLAAPSKATILALGGVLGVGAMFFWLNHRAWPVQTRYAAGGAIALGSVAFFKMAKPAA